MFILDDLSDEMSKDSDKLAAIYAKFLNILRGTQAEEVEGIPLGHGLQDIRQRLIKKATPKWMSRWLCRVEECWESWIWEAKNRKNGITLDLATYTKMRPLTGGLYTVIEMIDLTEQIDLPIEVRQHTAVQRLTLMTNNIFNYAKDIFFSKRNKTRRSS